MALDKNKRTGTNVKGGTNYENPLVVLAYQISIQDPNEIATFDLIRTYTAAAHSLIITEI